MNKQITTYQQACTYLDDLQMHKIKLGLEAMQTILAELGSPESACSAVHVAGTNGKGSVCTMLRTIMSQAGYKTGLYTSPHLSSVRERFRIDGYHISKDDFTRHMERIRKALDGRVITYFECATALAFSWFAEQGCDLVIIETGMGGRLDATNVLDPLLTVITTISLDHEEYLGDTVEAVAFEKAGIIKEKTLLISGVLEKGPRQVLERTAKDRQAPLVTREQDFFMEMGADSNWCWRDRNGCQIPDLILPAGGVWQIENSGMAIAAAVSLRNYEFKVPDEIIRAALKKSHWPGRMELMKISLGAQVVNFLLDGAHNRAGVDYLIEALERSFSYRKLIIVWGAMGDKEYGGLLRSIASKADHLLLTSPDSERSATPEDLAAVLDGETGYPYECIPRVTDVITRINVLATEQDLVVVAGSLYLVGEFRTLLVGEVVS